MLIKVEVEVEKEAYELGQGLAKVTKAAVDANADGWQMGEDLPKIAMVAFSQMAAMEGIDKIGEAMKADPAAFAKAVALGLADIYAAFAAEAPADPAA